MDIENLVIVFVTALVSGSAAMLLNYVKDVAKKHEREKEEKEKLLIQLKEQTEDFKSWREQFAKDQEDLNKSVNQLALKVNKVAEGSKVLLRDRIVQSCRVFAERGYITTVAKANIQDMYRWYHEGLRGNGLAEIYFKKMQNLPIKDPDIPETSSLMPKYSYEKYGETEEDNTEFREFISHLKEEDNNDI